MPDDTGAIDIPGPFSRSSQSKLNIAHLLLQGRCIDVRAIHDLLQ